MSFTDDLEAGAEPIWEATLAHPIVEGFGDGTLDVEPFRYWVRQEGWAV